jgi:hypothetical protein
MRPRNHPKSHLRSPRLGNSWFGACGFVTLRGSGEALNGREPDLLAGEDVEGVSEHAVGVCEGDDAVGDSPQDLIRV